MAKETKSQKIAPLETLQQLGLEINHDRIPALSKGWGGCRVTRFESAINEEGAVYDETNTTRKEAQRREREEVYTNGGIKRVDR